MAVWTRTIRRHAALHLVACLVSVNAAAATFEVSNGNDAGAGSLRDAISQANLAAGADVITFGAGVSSIGISGSELQITGPTTLTGPGASSLTLVRTAGSGRLLNLDGNVNNGADISLSGLGFDGDGIAAGTDGGCMIASSINLSLSDVRFADCNANHGMNPFAGGAGGALYVDTFNRAGCSGGICSLSISNAVFSGNSAFSGGGAVMVRLRDDANLTASNLTVSNNTVTLDSPGFSGNLGGGFAVIAFFDAGSVSFSNSSFSDNVMGTVGALFDPGAGGGLGIQYDGNAGIPPIDALTISDCSFSNNRAGEGGGGGLAIFNAQLQLRPAPPTGKQLTFPVVIERSIISGNTVDGTGRGGGLYLNDITPPLRKGAPPSSALIDRSTISGNSANQGGGLAVQGSFGTLTLRNSTVASNSTVTSGATAARGSGLYLGGNGTVALEHSSIAGNSSADSGGGVELASANTVALRIQNSLLDANVDASVARDIAFGGTPSFDLDYSLINAAPAATVAFDNAVAAGNGVLRNQSAALGALQNNGGPTLTRVPASGSPAINAGDPTFTGASTPTVDQRGLARFSGGRLDIGAVETAASPLLSATKTVSGSRLVGGSVTYTVVISNSGSATQADNAGDEFTDVLPTQLSLVSASANSGTAVANTGTRTVTWNGSLAVGASVTLTITATINPGTVEQSASNQGTVSYDSDGNGSNDATALTDDPSIVGAANATAFTILGVANLSATKTVSGSFAVGGTVTYSVVINNTGSGTQTDNAGDEFTDVLPTQLTLISAAASSGTAVATIGTRSVSWNGSLGAGASVTITITASVNAGSAGLTISNQGSLSYDSNADNTNDASALTDDPALAGAADPTAFSVPGPALLGASKTVTGSFIVGSTVSYSVVINNSGNSTQSDNAGDEFTDVLPTQLSLISASASSGTAVANIGTRTVTWNGSLAPAASVTLTISASINPGTLGQSVSNQGSVSYDSDANGSNDATALSDDPGVVGAANPTVFSVLGTASLSASKTVSGSFTSGGTVSYSVLISNGGGGAQADNAGNEFTDLLPTQLSLVSAAASSGTAAANIGTRTVTWNGSLAAGASVTITITASINAGSGGASISNQGSLSFDGDGNGSNESSALTDDPAVGGAADPTVFAVAAQSGSLQFSQPSYSVDENAPGKASLQISVTRSGGSDGAVSVSYATADETAFAGEDYVAASGTLNWAGGDSTARSITLTVIDDNQNEGNESFRIALSNPTGGATLGGNSIAGIFIPGNDLAPALVIPSSDWRGQLLLALLIALIAGLSLSRRRG